MSVPEMTIGRIDAHRNIRYIPLARALGSAPTERVDCRNRRKETDCERHDADEHRNRDAGAERAREALDVACADPLRRDDRRSAHEARSSENDRNKNGIRGGRTGKRDEAETSDRNRIDRSEKLIAEYLNGNGNRKAPERGANSSMVDDHRFHSSAFAQDDTVAVREVTDSRVLKNSSISTSVV